MLGLIFVIAIMAGSAWLSRQIVGGTYTRHFLRQVRGFLIGYFGTMSVIFALSKLTKTIGK